jgi:signal transduction histidine kinase
MSSALGLPVARGDAAQGGERDSEFSFDGAALERSLAQHLPASRWIGWRLRLLLVAVLVGCLATGLFIRHLGSTMRIDALWRVDGQGQLQLVASGDPGLRGFEGRQLLGAAGADGAVVTLDALALQHDTRWLVGDAQRQRHASEQAQLNRLLDHAPLRLFFLDGSVADVHPVARGAAGLGALLWLLSGLALVLYVLATAVVLAGPSARNLVYGVMAWCQAANLLFIAIELLPGLGMPHGFAAWDEGARNAFDLLTGAALVQAAMLHPRPLPWRRLIAPLAWGAALALALLGAAGELPHEWWAVQGAALIFGLAGIALFSWSYRLQPNPFALMLRRFAIVGVGTLALLTVAIVAAERQPGMQLTITTVGSVIWYVFLASLLLLVPFLSRSQQMMRQFSMLAGLSTVATSLDLLFVTLFSLGQFASLTLSLFLSLAAYAAARQWIVSHLLGDKLVTTERMFEHLYRIAREVEQRPERLPDLLTRMLRELFEPLELRRLDRPLAESRVFGDGSALLVPIPVPGVEPSDRAGLVLLRFARRGTRMFTREDARLTDRIVEQLRRAVAFDRAVEQGRSEERARIAQDLHDDIGARLLTLMYQAPTPDMEDYLRHTLQDLKTLTRGLAASSHPLTHAAAEWKADAAQRLAVAHCQLQWRFDCDQEVVLTVVQWSALTRMLRELVNNAISHSKARQVEIAVELARGILRLRVSDDGVGRAPETWSHGLGLGGIRKRVKQLGGEVEWRENRPLGIVCDIRIPELGGSG